MNAKTPESSGFTDTDVDYACVVVHSNGYTNGYTYRKGHAEWPSPLARRVTLATSTAPNSTHTVLPPEGYIDPFMTSRGQRS